MSANETHGTPQNAPPSIKEKAVHGMAWKSIGMLSMAVMQFVITVVLARLLSPRSFGLIAIVMLVSGFATIFSEMGLGAAIIQRQGVSDAQLSSFFGINMLMNAAIMAIVWIAAPFIALSFKQHEIVGLLRLSSFGLPLAAFGLGHRFLLRKELSFSRIALADICGTAAYGVFGIAGALAGIGVASLAIAFLAQQAVSSIFLWILYPWRPRLSEMRFRALSGMWSFGLNATGVRVVNYSTSNVDTIAIGHFFGSTALGYYNMAWKLTMMLISRFAPTIEEVAFPAFSLIQDETERLRVAYLKVIKNIALVTFPLLAALAVLAPEAIFVIYGPRWAPAVLLVQLLTVAGLARSVGNTGGNILYAKGRSGVVFIWNILSFGIYVPAVYLGAKWGVAGVAISMSALFVIDNLGFQIFVNHTINMKTIDYFKSLAVPATATTIMAICMYAVRLVGLSGGWSPYTILLSGILTGILAYFGSLTLIGKGAVEELGTIFSLALKIFKVKPSASAETSMQAH